MDNPQPKSSPIQYQLKPIQYQFKTALHAPTWTSRFHQGVGYTDVLNQIHQVRRPNSYLEIGVETGRTLAYARCRAVAIDPRFQFQGDPIGQRAETYLFQMKSDDFFARHDLTTFLPDGVDFAFLDGMHLFEYLLRDFMNTEKCSHRDTVFALHDCYPVNPEIANRDVNAHLRTDWATRGWWAGDVWKLLPILRDYRPDLAVTVLDCPPTGLVIVQGLDEGSRALAEAYDEIVAKYQNVTLETFGIDRFRAEFATTDSRPILPSDALAKFLKRRA